MLNIMRIGVRPGYSPRLWQRLISAAMLASVDNEGAALFSEDLSRIDWGAFKGSTSLTSVTLPEGLTSIGDCAFEGCSSLTSVTFPEGLANIGCDAFHGTVFYHLPRGP